MPIEGFPQMLKYGDSAQRLWCHLIKGGVGSDPKGGTTPQVTVYDVNGDSLLAATNLTQSGSTDWWYKDLDLSTLAWDKGLDYRSKTTWTTDDDLSNVINSRFDVVTDAFNEPLISTDDVDLLRPAWSGIMPTGWSDWSEAIKAAHRELMWKLRRMRVENVLVRPHLLLNRDQLYEVEMAFALRNIVDGIARLEEERVRYNEEALAAWASYMQGPFAYDSDDDQVVDYDEEDTPFSGPMFNR